MEKRKRYRVVLPLALALAFLSAPWARAARLVLLDGRVLEGKLTDVATILPTPGEPDDGPREILLCDDGLRRTWVGERQAREITPGEVGEPPERISLEYNRPRRSGREIVALGEVLETGQFDDFGRRRIRVRGPTGQPLELVQGITQITPVWTQVDVLEVPSGVLHKWDMRLGTSTIPNDRLAALIKNPARGIERDLGKRLQVARLYLQCERYRLAREEIESIQRDFPSEGERLEGTLRQLRQLSARQLLEELRLRHAAGQHRAVRAYLEHFPTEDVSGEILFEVRERLAQCDADEQSLGRFREQLELLAASVEDEALRVQLDGIVKEMLAEATPATLERLAPFSQLADDESLSRESRMALAVSSWLMGPAQALQDLTLALSVARVRGLVTQYLVTDDPQERASILGSLRSEVGAQPAYVAAVLKHMVPPIPPPSAEDAITPGHFRFQVSGLGPEDPPVVYHAQVPPEYDPRRRYPAVVTLHGAATTPELQIDWWAGESREGQPRSGEAMRHGYVVLAVQWGTIGKGRYGYSASEHHAVLAALRDACRRISIDTDRVFLSGHGSGGDAAWDIALAHPDLWAGAIPIGADVWGYCQHYRPNAAGLPFYFVCGQLAADSMVKNAPDFDHYLTRSGYDATVVEYRGRGHDHFQEEIKRLFDWMGRKSRPAIPRQFEVATMRPWDSFFWWLEVEGLPARSIVYPDQWPLRGARAAHLKGRIMATNGVQVTAGVSKVVVYLSPEMVDFSKPVTVQVNGRRMSYRSVEPNLETLLEDARRRADRVHPYWARLEL